MRIMDNNLSTALKEIKNSARNMQELSLSRSIGVSIGQYLIGDNVTPSAVEVSRQSFSKK